MEFERSSKELGCKYFFLALVSFLVCVALLVIDESDFPAYRKILFSFVFFGLLFVAVIFLLRGLVLLVSGSKWSLSLLEGVLVYRVPKTLMSGFFDNGVSFEIDLSEVRSVLYKSSWREAGGESYDQRCVFFLVSGMQYEIGNESGVNLMMLVEELRAYGVLVEEV